MRPCLTRQEGIWQNVLWTQIQAHKTKYLKISLRSSLRQISPNGHPIGHGHPEPVAEKEESTVLDHKSEAEHLASIVRDSADLKTSEEFKGLVVRLLLSRPRHMLIASQGGFDRSNSCHFRNRMFLFSFLWETWSCGSHSCTIGGDMINQS